MSNPLLVSDRQPVCVRAFANIALVKYWGKRDAALNLPCTGSLSLTLDPLATVTELVRLPADAEQDRIELNGEPAQPEVARRVSRFIDLIRERAGSRDRVAMRSRNTFPTAAGLASSASAFAALALAARDAFGLELPLDALSALARQGSGSAARSLFGGFCEMRPGGERADGTDAHAIPLEDEHHWPLRVVIAVVARGQKKIASTDGMEDTRKTSPYFAPWVDGVPADLAAARSAITARDFDALARVAERSALRMHASAIAADPGVLYWQPATVGLVHAVRQWRAEGVRTFFTIDAGPNVKIFCPHDEVDAVRERALAVDGVLETLVCQPGRGAHRVASFEDPTPLADA